MNFINLFLMCISLLALSGCASTQQNNPPKEIHTKQEIDKAHNIWYNCLMINAKKYDDKVSDALTIAKVINNICKNDAMYIANLMGDNYQLSTKYKMKLLDEDIAVAEDIPLAIVLHNRKRKK